MFGWDCSGSLLSIWDLKVGEEIPRGGMKRLFVLDGSVDGNS